MSMNIFKLTSAFSRQLLISSKTPSSGRLMSKISPLGGTSFHTSSTKLGLSEFFDDPENFGKEKIKSGSPWTKDLLRNKSAVELHQLWFVLLKERNMLQTQEYYCLDHDEPIPGRGRLDKVAESMSNLRDVIDERQQAKNMLLYGRPTKEGQEVRKSALGATYVHRYKEHLVPKELAKRRGDQPADIANFDRKIEEMHLRIDERRIKNKTRFNYLIRKQYNQYRSTNPSLPHQTPAWFRKRFKCTWKYGVHPRMYVFVKHHKKHDTRMHFTLNPKKTPERV